MWELWSDFDKQGGIWTVSYDIAVIIISYCDLISDLLVTYHFYQQNYTQFYSILTIILIGTHVSFTFSVAHNIIKSCGCSFWIQSFLLLPISPLLPLLLFIGSNPTRNSNSFPNRLKKWKLVPMETWTDYWEIENNSYINTWIFQKNYRHFLFLLQATFESTPSFIIQLVAILIFYPFYSPQTNTNYDTMIVVISLFFSFFSIIIKYPLFPSPIASVLTCDVNTFILCWTSWILDLVSCVWYCSFLSCIANQLYIYHWQFVEIYLQLLTFKMAICVIPYSSLYTIRKMLIKSTKCLRSTQNRTSLMIVLIWSIPELLQWIVLSLWNSVINEIKNCYHIHLIISSLTRYNIKTRNNDPMINSNYKFKTSILKFVQYGESKEEGIINENANGLMRCKSIFCTSSYNRLIRILAVNYCFLNDCYINFNPDDHPVLYSYLKSQLNRCSMIQYNGKNKENKKNKLRYSTLRNNTMNTEESDIFYQINKLYCNHCQLPQYFVSRFKNTSKIYYFLLKYLLCPLYILSRFLSILIPFFLLYYEFIHSKNIPLFQICWIVLHCIITIIVLICFISCLRIHWFWWHIIPGFEKNIMTKPMIINSKMMDTIMTRIWFYHDEFKYKQLREDIIINKFGMSLGHLILEFVGLFRLINEVASDQTLSLEKIEKHTNLSIEFEFEF